MKICYIAAGTSLHTQRWVNYFARKEHEVHLISSRFTDGYKGYDKRIKTHPLIRLLPQIWKISRYLSGILWLFQVYRLVKKTKPDILDAHYITLHGYLGVISGFRPLVLTAWGSDILITPKRSSFYRFLTKYALRRAKGVICDSETVRRGLLELDVDPVKIRMVYNGVDTGQFNPQRKDSGLRSGLGVQGAPVVICIRHLAPIYNVEMFIKAIPSVLNEVPGAKFIIGGDGGQREYLESLADSLGVSNSVRFIGYVPHDELPKYLASSDLYVSTSLSDSTSLSLQEAMACELAPVVTDLPANREWITDGENGFIVPINDIQTLADKIIYLLRNKETKTKFGKVGREIIKERAEYEQEMSRVEKIYQELVESSK